MEARILERNELEKLLHQYNAKVYLIKDNSNYRFTIKVDAPGNLTGWSNSVKIEQQIWVLDETVEIETKKGLFKKEIEQFFLFSNGNSSFLFPAYIFIPFISHLMKNFPDTFDADKLLRTKGLRFSLPK